MFANTEKLTNITLQLKVELYEYPLSQVQSDRKPSFPPRESQEPDSSPKLHSITYPVIQNASAHYIINSREKRKVY